jgi:cellulose synthase operon protein C
MRLPRSLPVLSLAFVAALGLAGCDTAEERAEKHYERGMTLLADGDTDRALVEFRNVFRLNKTHVPALSEYAAILAGRGELKEAANSYSRVLEIDPHDFNAHLHLAEILIKVDAFDDAAVNVSEALRLSPEDPQARALKATIDFRAGTDRPAAVALAEAVAAEAPGTVAAQMVLIADRLDAGDLGGALARADAALAEAPGDEGLHLARLSILEKRGDIGAVGEELVRMTALFPENGGARDALVQWHLQDGDAAAAEAVLRDAAAAAPDDPERALEVVQFLYELRGPEAAAAELERRIAAAANPLPFQRALAGIDFTEGRTEKAIAAVRGLLEAAKPSPETRDLQVLLAGMLADTGAEPESAALVEAVLGEDRSHAGALKLRAQGLIAAGDTDAAVRDMRLALSRSPDDPEILTIMALAYDRAGNRELMGAQLAQAVEASGNGAAESLRYAAYLMQEDHPDTATGILSDALRAAPEDPDLLHMLGRIHIAESDWAGAGRIIGRLEARGDPGSMALATALETESLQARDETGLLADLLDDLARGDGREVEMARTVKARMMRGDTAAARAYLGEVLKTEPENVPARLLLAGLYSNGGEAARAEALYRAAIAAAPADARAYEALMGLLAGEGREDEAAAVAETGLDAAAPAPRLQFALAGLAEARGDLPRAIALYGALHGEDPDNPVIANNLASLLSADIAMDPAARPPEDAARLERAHAIAAPLQEIDAAPLQDTYGWILALKGDPEGALAYLEPAAAALPENAQVQYHLGEAAFALGRWDLAEAGFAGALAAHAAGSPLPQAGAVRARLVEAGARTDAAAPSQDN